MATAITVSDTYTDTTFKVEGYEGHVHLEVVAGDVGSVTLTPEQARGLASVLSHFAVEQEFRLNA